MSSAVSFNLIQAVRELSHLIHMRLLPLRRVAALSLIIGSLSALGVFDRPIRPVLADNDDVAWLEVHHEPSGGVRATAALVIPAPPHIVQDILTDFPKWPELFAVKMRVASLEWREGRAITDLYIQHGYLPGERRLLCESEVLPDGKLVTRLLGGDFKRYQRTWTFSPVGDGSRTRAEFELLVEVETLAPDWLIAFTLKRELEAHFRILTSKAAGRDKREG